jgi:acyl-ACP thioesterase
MDLEAPEFVDCPEDGRRTVARRRVRLGDVTVSGRLRLDALARYLQDVAADDVDDAGIAGAWVLRRADLRFGSLPAFRDDVELTTFCSGVGPRWAERRTTLYTLGPDGAREVAAESVAIWVYVDGLGRPASLEDWFMGLYRSAINGRKVSGRLRHGRPPETAASRPWVLRRADFDVLRHLNNAVSWAAVEDVVGDLAAGRRLAAAEIEYRSQVDPGDEVELRTTKGPDRVDCWLTVGGETRVSVAVHLGPEEPGFSI